VYEAYPIAGYAKAAGMQAANAISSSGQSALDAPKARPVPPIRIAAATSRKLDSTAT
jgi:hypothetical protein